MLKKVKTAVFVSGGGTNLQALIDACSSGKMKNVELSLVVSNNVNAYALTRARKHGIKTEVIPKKEMTQKAFEDKLCKLLETNGIELIVLAGFMCILSGEFTSKYDKRIINIHPSLIPSFCGKGYYGLRVHEAALERGVKVTGATVHYVNEIPDGGEIILQKSVKINKSDTAESLQKRVMKNAEWIILPKACDIAARKFYKERNKK